MSHFVPTFQTAEHQHIQHILSSRTSPPAPQPLCQISRQLCCRPQTHFLSAIHQCSDPCQTPDRSLPKRQHDFRLLAGAAAAPGVPAAAAAWGAHPIRPRRLRDGGLHDAPETGARRGRSRRLLLYSLPSPSGGPMHVRPREMLVYTSADKGGFASRILPTPYIRFVS